MVSCAPASVPGWFSVGFVQGGRESLLALVRYGKLVKGVAWMLFLKAGIALVSRGENTAMAGLTCR